MKRNRPIPKKTRPRPSLKVSKWGATIALLVVVSAFSWWWFSRTNEPTTNRSNPMAELSAASPKISPSNYLSTKADAMYVGTARCQECHGDQHESYLHTAHSRSMSLVDPAREPADGVYDHRLSGRRYRVYRKENEFRHQESLLLSDGQEFQLCDFPMKYLVGSGRFSRSYLAEDQDFLVESPATWYSSLQTWKMSPGYDADQHLSFHRTVTHDCLYCHASDISRIQGSDERLKIREAAIGCERCHGPGSHHVAKWTKNDSKALSEVDESIVNPRHLSRELAEAVCHQCHLNGDVRVPVRGRKMEEFRPGLPWHEFVLDYRFETEKSDMKVVGHTEQLRLSRCYQADDSMTCTTCHDPHLAIGSTDAKQHYRSRCLNCHEDQSCRFPPTEREQKNQNDCAGCHMPQSPTDIPHIAFTHHRIGIHRQTRSDENSDSNKVLARLVPTLSDSHLSDFDQRRSLGLAYFQYFRDHRGEPGVETLVPKAQETLEEIVEYADNDVAVLVALGEIAALRGDFVQATELLTKAKGSTTNTAADRIGALRALVEISMRQQQYQQATELLMELTVLRRNPGDWMLLGIVHQQSSRISEAIEAFERVIQIDPAPIEPYQALAALYQLQGNAERARWCLTRIQQLNKLGAPAQ